MKKRKTHRKIFGINFLGHLEAIMTGIKYLFKPRLTLMYPESLQNFGHAYHGMLKFFDDRCISCTFCARICPSGAIKMYKKAQTQKKWPGVNYQRCVFCGFCVDICPVNALEMSSVHDKVYYTLDRQLQKPEDFVKGPLVEKQNVCVKAVFDKKRGLKYEHS